ncbi:MAG: right-handed parallel beta-helix repeat-containing protein, partial [bacterium]
ANGGSSGGLAVEVSGEGQAYLQRYNLDEWPHLEFPRDTYFRLELNPAGVSIPEGETVALVRLRDGDWNVIAGVRLAQEAAGYVVFLELPDGSFDTVKLALTDAWHTVVLGCRMSDWVGLWVDDDQEQVVTGVQHDAAFVQVLILGKADGNWSGQTPSGTVYIDDVTLLYASYPELWVDAATGEDTAEGNAAGVPLQTIQLAATLAGPGTVIHVAPGDYRESVLFPTDGTESAPIRVVADGGRDTARILGSNPASTVSWVRLTDPSEIDLPAGVDVSTATIWKADLTDWALEDPPRFVMLRPGGGGGETLTRLPLAREPDWHVATEWKHHEYWWAAEGGTGVTTCDPVADPDCDDSNRSDRWLTDTSDDPAPADIEPGHLASLGDVTGAIVYVKGTRTGHYTYRRRVAETDTSGGRVRLEALPEAYTEGCWFDHDPSMPNLGWHSKYFLEGLAKFLDTPGEWFFDEATQTIYIWTPDGQAPDQLGVEISARDTGVDLSHRSYIELTDLDIGLFHEQGIRITGSGSEDERVYGITLSGLDIGWSTRGLHLAHGPEPSTAPGSQTRSFTLRDSRVHDMESLAIYFWTGSGQDFVRPGITDVIIAYNEFARIGFRDNEQGSVGLSFQHADHLLFEGNHVHHIAHNGVVFSKAQTQSSPGHHVPAEDIKTGDILVRGNVFEHCVQNATDAGGLKFWGANADRSHTFRDTLVIGNVSRNNVGWAWVSEARQNWTYHGKGGMGYYIDFAGGVHLFRNIAHENGLAGFMASGSWIDQGAVLVNNTIVNSPRGYTMGVRDPFNDQNAGLVIANTIFLHTQRFALGVGDERILDGEVVVDHNLYHLVGYEDWPQHTPGILSGHVDSGGYQEFPTLADVQGEVGLEQNGAEGDPALAGFDPALTDGAWQDFRLTAGSTLAIDTGAPLPVSLVALLGRFGIDPGQRGAALDRGAIELDPDDPDAPYVIDVGPGDGTRAITTPWGTDFPDPSVTPPSGDDKGCGCRSGAGAGTPTGAVLLLLLALATLRRTRRPRGRKRDHPAFSPLE